MKPYQICHKYGVKSLKELSIRTGRSPHNLVALSKNNPRFFKQIILGVVEEQKREELKKEILEEMKEELS